jgi:hypothetical protein
MRRFLLLSPLALLAASRIILPPEVRGVQLTAPKTLPVAASDFDKKRHLLDVYSQENGRPTSGAVHFMAAAGRTATELQHNGAAAKQGVVAGTYRRLTAS